MITQIELEEMSAYVAKMAAKIRMLEEESNKIMDKIMDKEDDLYNYRKYFSSNMKNLRLELVSVQEQIDKTNAAIRNLIVHFKGVVRKDKFLAFNDSIEEIPFEFFLTRKEAKEIIANEGKFL